MAWKIRLSSNALIRLAGDGRGASVVEFGLVLPFFAVMLFGLLGYGQYFLLAHSVQQIANDAARATVSGLNPVERVTLANASVTAAAASLPELPATRLSTTVEESGTTITVRVRFDASHIGLLSATLLPMPDTVIERRAVIRAGGST